MFVLVWFEVSMLSYAHDLVLCVPTRTAPGVCCCPLLSFSRRCCSGSDSQQRQLSRSRRRRSFTCSRHRYVRAGSAAPRAHAAEGRPPTLVTLRQLQWLLCTICYSLSGQVSHLSPWLSGNCMQVHVLLCCDAADSQQHLHARVCTCAPYRVSFCVCVCVSRTRCVRQGVWRRAGPSQWTGWCRTCTAWVRTRAGRSSGTTRRTTLIRSGRSCGGRWGSLCRINTKAALGLRVDWWWWF